MTSSQTPPWASGRWLARERERLGLSAASLAHSLGQHPNTVHAIERHDRLLPPGWMEPLRTLGIEVPQPTCTRLYWGSQLHAELAAKPHLRLTPYELSRKLSVPEEEIRAVLVGDHLVPGIWLPKLAELGLDGWRRLAREEDGQRGPRRVHVTPLAKEEPPEFLLRWTQERGLLLRVSGPLLDALPHTCRELLALVQASGLSALWTGVRSPQPEDERHGAQ